MVGTWTWHICVLCNSGSPPSHFSPSSSIPLFYFYFLYYFVCIYDSKHSLHCGYLVQESHTFHIFVLSFPSNLSLTLHHLGSCMLQNKCDSFHFCHSFVLLLSIVFLSQIRVSIWYLRLGSCYNSFNFTFSRYILFS